MQQGVELLGSAPFFIRGKGDISFLFTYFPVMKIVAQLATFCSFGIDFFSVSLYNDIEDKTKTDGGI